MGRLGRGSKSGAAEYKARAKHIDRRRNEPLSELEYYCAAVEQVDS